jgi:hypothetical protein
MEHSDSGNDPESPAPNPDSLPERRVRTRRRQACRYPFGVPEQSTSADRTKSQVPADTKGRIGEVARIRKDFDSRAKLREEIRRKVARIDITFGMEILVADSSNLNGIKPGCKRYAECLAVIS